MTRSDRDEHEFLVVFGENGTASVESCVAFAPKRHRTAPLACSPGHG
jgi:hypothetical protein